MDEFLMWLWDLRAVVVFMAGVSAGLLSAAVMFAARQNDEPKEVTDEGMDMVDVQGFFQKWED